MNPCYIIRDFRAIADLTPDSDGGAWQINRINVPRAHRGHGIGSLLLDQICAEADQQKITLWLLPTASGGLSDWQLAGWYGRRGFRWAGEPGRSKMVRRPR